MADASFGVNAELMTQDVLEAICTFVFPSLTVERFDRDTSGNCQVTFRHCFGWSFSTVITPPYLAEDIAGRLDRGTKDCVKNALLKESEWQSGANARTTRGSQLSFRPPPVPTSLKSLSTLDADVPPS